MIRAKVEKVVGMVSTVREAMTISHPLAFIPISSLSAATQKCDEITCGSFRILR